MLSQDRVGAHGYGLGRKRRFGEAAAGGGGGGGIAVVEALAKEAGFSKNLAVTDATYNRMYASMWVKRPPQNASSVGVFSWWYRDSLANALLYSHESMFGGNTTYDVFPRIVIPLTTGESISRTYDASTLTADASNALWTHILYELDTTEAVADDRLKIYVNDTKITSFSDASTASTQNKTIATGSNTPNTMYLYYTDWAGYGVNDGVTRIAGFWMKFATSNLFDFDVAADRRNFITAGLGYVTHESSMGGQTADIWGAGNKAAWAAAGWTATALTSDESEVSITATN